MRLTQLAETLTEDAIKKLLKLKKSSARLKALQKQRAKLLKQLVALDRRLGKAAGKLLPAPRKRRLSAAGRRRIILAQKRRWAAARAKKA